MIRSASLVVGLALACAASASAEASVIDNRVWESYVAQAPWIAVVECERAGVRVSRFRVVEPWKGPLRVGRLVTLPRSALVGERYLIVSEVRRALSGYLPAGWGPGSCVVTTSLPIHWRRLQLDGSGTGVRLPADAGALRSAFRARHKDLAEFKRATLELLALPEPERERRVLLSLARRHVPKGLRGPILERLERCASSRELVGVLLAEQDLLTSSVVSTVVLCGGSKGALAALEAAPGQAKLLERFREFCVVDETEPTSDSKAVERLLPQKVRDRQLRYFYGSLYAGEPGRRTFSLELLERDLAQGKPGIRKTAQPFGDSSYDYVSTLCALYPAGRVDFLRRLLRAKDPWARVAGAVYLLPESHAEAHLALERFARLPGEPGAWAALTLARRGHAAYVDALLRLQGREKSNAWLHARTLVLLSNSAARAGVPAPPKVSWHNREPAEQEDLRSWWGRHRVQLERHVRDPWLEELAGQRVD